MKVVILAESKSGTKHRIIGRVRGGISVPYETEEEGNDHLLQNGWKPIRRVT